MDGELEETWLEDSCKETGSEKNCGEKDARQEGSRKEAGSEKNGRKETRSKETGTEKDGGEKGSQQKDSREETGCEGMFFTSDVTDADQVNDMVKQVIDKFGKIDILVNNAGIDRPPADSAKGYRLEEIPLEENREIFEVNTLGLFQVTQVFGARMVAAGGAAHTDHGMSMLDLFREVVSGKIPEYSIKDPEKLRQVAASVGIEVEDREIPDIAKDLCGLLEEQAKHVAPEGLAVHCAALEGKPQPPS